MDSQERIKKHFEEEANQYDQIILNLIPHYRQMTDALVAVMAFDSNAAIEVLDLGCGTGTIAAAVKKAYPKAHLTCVDISQNMLDIARAKLGESGDESYILSDFYDLEFPQKYDVVVSSLALHHLRTKADKQSFYHKIYDGLKEHGQLINADVILAPTDELQAKYMQVWRSFMITNISQEEADNKWIPTYYAEDRPVTIKEHFAMMDKAGFRSKEVVWKYYNFAVYLGEK